jgi:hypothetical protein
MCSWHLISIILGVWPCHIHIECSIHQVFRCLDHPWSILRCWEFFYWNINSYCVMINQQSAYFVRCALLVREQGICHRPFKWLSKLAVGAGAIVCKFCFRCFLSCLLSASHMLHKWCMRVERTALFCARWCPLSARRYKSVGLVFAYTVWPCLPGKENNRWHTIPLLPCAPSWPLIGWTLPWFTLPYLSCPPFLYKLKALVGDTIVTSICMKLCHCFVNFCYFWRH